MSILDRYFDQILIIASALMIGGYGWLLISGRYPPRRWKNEPPSWIPSELRSSGSLPQDGTHLERECCEHQGETKDARDVS